MTWGRMTHWRIIWDEDIVWDEDTDGSGGYIATNGQMFMAPSVLRSLAPDIYRQCMADAGLLVTDDVQAELGGAHD